MLSTLKIILFLMSSLWLLCGVGSKRQKLISIDYCNGTGPIRNTHVNVPGGLTNGSLIKFQVRILDDGYSSVVLSTRDKKHHLDLLFIVKGNISAIRVSRRAGKINSKWMPVETGRTFEISMLNRGTNYEFIVNNVPIRRDFDAKIMNTQPNVTFTILSVHGFISIYCPGNPETFPSNVTITNPDRKRIMKQSNRIQVFRLPKNLIPGSSVSYGAFIKNPKPKLLSNETCQNAGFLKCHNLLNFVFTNRNRSAVLKFEIKIFNKWQRDYPVQINSVSETIPAANYTKKYLPKSQDLLLVSKNVHIECKFLQDTIQIFMQGKLLTKLEPEDEKFGRVFSTLDRLIVNHAILMSEYQ